MPVPKQIYWQPNEPREPGGISPQVALLACPIEDVGFGGSRGGGKTAGMLGDFWEHEQRYGKFARGVFFRRTYGELEEVIRQADAMFLPLGWKKKGGIRPTYTAPSGATLKLRAIQRDSDADKYQGHSYTWIGFDEATNWPSPEPLDKLRACLRASEAQIRKRWIMTANPGGVGHNWYKARYIDPAPAWSVFDDVTRVPGLDGKPMELRIQRVFIPSTLDDNPQLLINDPMYWVNVVASANGRDDLIKAWRWGMWDIVAGGMIDDVWRRHVHVLPQFRIPHSWRINRSFDWGSSKPYSVGWWAESDGTQLQDGRCWPRGTLFRINELYGWNGKPNQGTKELAVDIAVKILEIEGRMGYGDRVQPGPADSSIYDAENGVSIAADMAKKKVTWSKADKSPGSRKTGAEKVRQRLGACLKTPMEEPGLFCFANCTDGFIRTVPVLARDKKVPDDVDTKAEDHTWDETRYRVLEVRREIKTQRLGGL